MTRVSFDRLRILHILALGSVGGLNRVVEALALGQSRQGHQVFVAAVQGPDGDADHPFLQLLRRGGVGVIPVMVPRRGYREEYRRISEICRHHWPDLVHTHGYRPDLVGASAARAIGLPTVTTVHGFTGGGLKNQFYQYLQRRSFRRFSAVCAVSRALVRDLLREGLPSGLVHLVPNGWHGEPPPLGRTDARVALGITSDHFQIGWVGRISGEKGPDTMIEALERLGHLPFQASFLGDGPERLRLERMAATSPLAWKVRWHGMVPDAGRYLAAFDALVISSRTEGMPIILFEAMAAGVPVIATRVGGIPEVVTAREAALVPPDDPAALALAIEAVYLDRSTALNRTSAAHRRLHEEFDMTRSLNTYEELYRRLRSAQTP